SGILEIVSVEGLVEDALRLESSELKDQNVRIQRVFEPVPPIAIDRNKVLQILVNLLRNAVQALAARGDEERHIVLGIAPCAEGGVFIHVQDSGEGVAPEELAKIFAFGYTTRSDGHGFGLHHGANAAKEM